MPSDVRGICPACGTRSLFVGTGGHITCSLSDCPDPMMLDRMLRDRRLMYDVIRELLWLLQERGVDGAD